MLRFVPFRRLFLADLTSSFGTHLSYLAIPLLAVTALHASPLQVGVLTMVSTMAFLLVGLPAGAWVDRWPKRSVLIAADVVRAIVLGWVPLAWAAGILTLPQLYVVGLVAGIATVFFDVAQLSYLPLVVGRDRLIAANTSLVSAGMASEVAGRGVGGYLIQLVGAPVTVLIDATTYLLSALFLRAVPISAASAENVQPGQPLRRQVLEGIHFVASHRWLRAIAAEGALTNLSLQICLVAFLVLFSGELDMSAGVLGLFLAVGGVGAVVGALSAGRIQAGLGTARALWLPGLVSVPFIAVVAVIEPGPLGWLAGIGWFVVLFNVGVDNVLKVAIRQQATPDELLGRMNATFRFLLNGALPVGALLSGVIGNYWGARTALLVGLSGLAVRWLITYLGVRNDPATAS